MRILINAPPLRLNSVVDICAGALGFWAFGWAIAYGVDPKDPTNVNGFAGTGEWLMIQVRHAPCTVDCFCCVLSASLHQSCRCAHVLT